jgi:hypothetical protein
VRTRPHGGRALSEGECRWGECREKWGVAGAGEGGWATGRAGWSVRTREAHARSCSDFADLRLENRKLLVHISWIWNPVWAFF